MNVLKAVSHVVDHSPGAMTNRARVYLWAAGLRHLLIGAFLLGMPWLFSAAAFVPIFSWLPLAVWGVAMFLDGAACIVAAVTRNGNLARAGMVLSATITLLLGVGLSIGVSLVWVNWLDQVGVDNLIYLLKTHPTSIPPHILAVSLPPPSPFLPLIMLAVTAKDFAVCAQPLRVPLEDLGTRRLRVT